MPNSKFLWVGLLGLTLATPAFGQTVSPPPDSSPSAVGGPTTGSRPYDQPAPNMANMNNGGAMHNQPSMNAMKTSNSHSAMTKKHKKHHHKTGGKTTSTPRDRTEQQSQ